jgi:hypothetical protein
MREMRVRLRVMSALFSEETLMCGTVEWLLSDAVGISKMCPCSVADTSGEVCGVKGCIEKHAYGCFAVVHCRRLVAAHNLTLFDVQCRAIMQRLLPSAHR